MTDFLKAYSIQYWLESCPQGYLLGTEYGHEPDQEEPPDLLESPVLREQAIRLTVQLIAGERCALHASSGLIRSAPDEASKRFLATQTLDEARHVEVFTKRLFDLGIKKGELEDVIKQLVNPNLVRFAEVLLEKVDAGDYVAGVVGQNVILEGMAFSVFEMLHSANRDANPKFHRTLSGTIADERRHVGFGENSIGALVRQHADAKRDIEKMQEEMSYYMLATFSEQFSSGDARAEQEAARKLRESRGASATSPAKWHGVDMVNADPKELEAALSDTILSAFKMRLGRMGLEYQTPRKP